MGFQRGVEARSTTLWRGSLMAEAWSRVFDFTVSGGGWAVNPGNGGSWLGGSIGWHSIFTFDAQLYIRYNLPFPAAISRIEVVYSVADSISNGANDIIRIWDQPNITGNLICDFNDTQPDHISYSDRDIVFASNCGNARSILYSVQSNGVNSLKRLMFEGTGPNPFLGNDGADCSLSYSGIDIEEAN